jgi:hypothetical protein
VRRLHPDFIERTHPDLIVSSHIITRSYSGVVVRHGAHFGWELEDRFTGSVLHVSERSYTSPRGAATALYRVAQATQDSRDLRDATGGEE